MNKYIKEFFQRGLIFGGLGPLVYGIVFLCLHLSNVDVNVTGLSIFKGIFSVYILGFVVAGLSVIWSIDKLGLGYAILIHGTSIYLCYLLTYLLNNWIKMSWTEVGIFSLVFILSYLIIWLIIYIIEKCRAKSFNKKMH